MHNPTRSILVAWPALAAALVYGLVEWLALSRSRAGDAFGAWRRTLSRR